MSGVTNIGDAKRKRASRSNGKAARKPTGDWRDLLNYADNGGLRTGVANVTTILLHHEDWQGVLGRNEFSAAPVCLLKPAPFRGMKMSVRSERQLSHLGLHFAVEEYAHGQGDPDENTPVQMGGESQSRYKRYDADNPVGLLDLVGVNNALEIDKADDGHHDDGGQDGLGQMIQKRRKKHQYNDNECAGKHAGQTGYGAGLNIHGGTGKRSGYGITLPDGSQDICQALPDKFLVRIQALPRTGRHGFGDGNGLHEAEN